MTETTELSTPEPVDLAARSLARVAALPPLPKIYRCGCGLVRFIATPCAECLTPAITYLYLVSGSVKAK